ncbi:MAG: hypothetical protein NZM35_04010 [Chitinophagales bacterium]|nr:hypothetical protein [Chitinophagales bacterium]MDW8419852.1 hypothetical protein [Chitinophagales bacterium]
MMRFVLVILSLSILVISHAQKPAKVTPAPAPVPQTNRSIAAKDLQKIKRIEDTLARLCETMTYDSVLANRQQACYQLIPTLVRALNTDNSFYYPFDSLITVSRIYPSDSSFRIFTWQLVLPGGRFRYYGFIQMRSTKLKMFPLHDRSDTMVYHPQWILTNENWYGCLYYNIITQYINRQPVYTLFGYEAADLVTRRKLMEILTFNEQGKPVFGAPLIYVHVQADSFRNERKDTFNRYFIEYKYNAPTVFNYDPELQMVVFDHVAPPNEKARGATFSYVPDGTYEGFLWKSNRWNWVERVFTFAINQDNNPPIPVPLFDKPTRQPELPVEIDKPK